MSGVSNYIDSTFREHGIQLLLKILFFCDFWSFMMILGKNIFSKGASKTRVLEGLCDVCRALRVFPAVTRLTVYRRRPVFHLFLKK